MAESRSNAHAKLKPDAERFLNVLFPRLNAHNRIEVRLKCLGKGQELSDRRFFSVVDGAVEYALANYEAYEVFFGVAARGPKTIGKKHNLTYISALFADLDIGKHWKAKDEARAALEDFTPAPSIIVDSGGGLHGYWLLKEPAVFGRWRCREKCPDCQEKRRGVCSECRVCMAEKNPNHIPAEMDMVEGVMRGFVEALHLDNVWDATRILRVPGTRNNKPGRPPRPVTMLQFIPDDPYDLEALAHRYYRPRPDEDAEPPQRFFPSVVPKGKAVWKRLKEKAKAQLSDGEYRSLVGMVEKNDARRFRNSEGKPGDRSGMNKSAAKKLRRLGADNGDILAIFLAFPIGEKLSEAKKGGKVYLRNTILAADEGLRKGGHKKPPKPVPRHIDYGWWFHSFACRNVEKVLRALAVGPQTMLSLMSAISASRPTAQKWLDLAIDVGWANAESKVKTGGNASQAWSLTESGQQALRQRGRMRVWWVPLYVSPAARSLYLKTNPEADLTRPSSPPTEDFEVEAVPS